MARHQLIISRDKSLRHPVRSEAGQFEVTTRVVVNWKGTWGPYEQHETYLVVAPQDEIEIVLATGERDSSLWFIHETEQTPQEQTPRSTTLPLFEQAARSLVKLQDDRERVDIKEGSEVLQVNHALASEPRELRCYLRISDLGKRPPMIAGQGNPGSLTTTKP